MRVVKRLYFFILKSFLPLFAMTFFIVLFIVLMQFLWRYIDDLVGKGLSPGLLAELFFYAALSMVPMALPLAILLASLMTFGNLGERSELTAIKASGVSLVKTMSPLIIFISMIAVGAFFFQNDVLPKAQVKMWTLLFSARQKSPELEIPEGTFYDQIPGYNLYVKSKDKETGMLRDVMIYDVSKGGDNSTILLSDSARLAFTPDMRYLYLHLYKGEQFENLREQRYGDRNVPFRRETFQDKEVLIPFDANFNRLDEGGMRNQYVGKNITELRQTIDSLNVRIDSLGRAAEAVTAKNRVSGRIDMADQEKPSNLSAKTETKAPAIAPLNLDSLLQSLPSSESERLFSSAGRMLQNKRSEMEFRALQVHDEKWRLRRHEIELIKKFTLSVACIIFLFIGAPLGAIIRKGGLGTPLVISVLLFLVYYIIDNTGYKLARDGHWIVWCGMWLSTFILLPLGIFVTYKAMNDSAVFNGDLYKEWLRRRLGLPEHRHVTSKEVVINDVNSGKALGMIESLQYEALSWVRTHKTRAGYSAYWAATYSAEPIDRIGDGVERLVEYLSDTRDIKVIDALNDYPVVKSLWILRPFKSEKISSVMKWFFPIGVIFYLLSLPYARRIDRDIKRTIKANQKLAGILS
ncbi:MAG: LptF/LptG family permease [Muribaculaceae bacterium]|nr:LptF/LptG family permease [Muribaculaceae bacterium]